MDPKSIKVLTLFIIGTAAVGGTVYLAMPQPPAVLSYPPVVDLGQQRSGTQVTGRFTIANQGGLPLVLTDFATSCSCAGVEIETEAGLRQVQTVEVAPGGQAELLVRIAAGARVGSGQGIAVEFASNDPLRPTGTIRVLIPRLLGGVHLDPAVASFGEVPAGDTSKLVVRLNDNGIPGRSITAVNSLNPDRFTARFLAATPTDPVEPHPLAGDYLGQIELIPVLQGPGTLRGQFEVCVSDEAKPQKVDVFGEVVGRTECRPDKLVLPRFAAGKLVDRAGCFVTWRGRGPVSLTVEHAPTGVTATVRAAPSGFDGWVVDVRADATVSPAKLRLLARGADGVQEQIEVTILAAPTDTLP